MKTGKKNSWPQTDSMLDGFFLHVLAYFYNCWPKGGHVLLSWCYDTGFKLSHLIFKSFQFWRYTEFSSDVFGSAFKRNSPFKARILESTTYIQFSMNDHVITNKLSTDIPCSLWPVVASFMLTGICVMTTSFIKVRWLTLSSKETSTVAVDLTGFSLKVCADWSDFRSDSMTSLLMLLSFNIDSIWFLRDLILSDTGNRSNYTHSINLVDVVCTFLPSQFFHCKGGAPLFNLMRLTRQRAPLPNLNCFSFELSVHIACAPVYMRRAGSIFLSDDVLTWVSPQIFIILSLMSWLTRVFPSLFSVDVLWMSASMITVCSGGN